MCEREYLTLTQASGMGGGLRTLCVCVGGWVRMCYVYACLCEVAHTGYYARCVFDMTHSSLPAKEG